MPHRNADFSKLFRTFSFAALAFLFAGNISAQNNRKYGGGYAASGQLENVNYTTQIYDASNGLPTSDANYILGTRDGYVWIAGYSGIIRYNGSIFERLPTNFGLTNGRGLFEDSKGRLWVATNDNGVVVLYDGKSRHYTYKDGLPSSSTRVFAEDGRGNIFIGTTTGLVYIDPTGILYPIDDERINEERIQKLVSDTRGRIYGQTKNGIVFSIIDGAVSQLYKSSELGIEKITTILADPIVPGRIYYGTQDTGIYLGDFGKTRSFLKKIDVSPLKDVHWLSYDCGRVWISSTTMAGYLDEKDRFHLLSDIPMNSAIEMTTSDYQGNIWMASSTQGIMKIVTNNFSDLSKASGLSRETTNATCLHNGLLYIGTDKGLRIIDSQKHRLENELTKFIGSSRVRCILEDAGKNLWLATYSNSLGIVCQSPDGKISSISTKNGLLSNQIRCFAETEDGRILAGTTAGLAVIKEGKVIKTTGPEEVRNKEFLTVCEGENGNIYAGSDGDGIYVIGDSKITRIGRDEGLTSDVVMRIKKDRNNGGYWIITSNSLQYLKNGQIKKISSFPYNNNYDIYDNKGTFWILSSYGLYSVNGEELINDSIKEYRLYTVANGLPFTITGNSYSTIDGDGNFYISGREGVIRVNINHYFDRNPDIKVDLNSLYCDDRQIFANANGDFVLPPSKGRIKLTPSVLDYTMSNPLIKVFLEGYGDTGITMHKNNISALEYTRLSYGDYKLHIQVLDSDDKSVLIDETFGILKKPSITELFIFRILLLAFLIVAAGFIVWRVMKSTVISRQYAEIRHAKEEAERASTAKTRFLSNMSQQILIPISTIMGMNEMILREETKNVPKSYFMAIANYAFDINTASENLLTLINDLLEMSKIESGSLQLVQQEYDVQELLRSIISLVKVKSTEKQLKFDIDADEMLPKRLYGDSGKIKQVVLNLLTNAVKYTEEGGFSLKLSMETRNGDSCGLCFSVKDTGIGIRQEEVENLFTSYDNILDDSSNEHFRTSLGLNISRKFAELMGGVLVCQSEFGEGSQFIFTLEQKIVDASPIGVFRENIETRNKGPYIPQFVAPDADVLVVEDNPITLNVIRSLLKATRVFVTTAGNCEDCLAMIRNTNFNIVFMNHNIPGIDGEEAVQKIRGINQNLPVYAITENSSSSEEFYRSKGYTGCISIPLDTALLERTIMRHLPEETMFRPTKNDKMEVISEIPQNLLWINDTEGISVPDGIDTSGGIGSFIFALNLFLDTIDDNAQVIEKAYKEGDFKLYGTKVRILKTSASFIGATSLYDLSEKLEEACKKDDRIFIAANTDRLLSEYISFKEKLSRIKDGA